MGAGEMGMFAEDEEDMDVKEDSEGKERGGRMALLTGVGDDAGEGEIRGGGGASRWAEG